MKILAFNSSPRKDRGNTHRILKPFLDGARDAGAEVETVFLHGRKIKPCIGCYSCWIKTPGECVQKDEAQELLERARESDIVVYATPLYVFGMNATLKLLLDRIMPGALPFIEVGADGHTTHPDRSPKKTTGMVVVSNCGFHELHNFNEMIAHFKIIAKHMKVNYLGALLRPEGEFLLFAEKLMPEAAKAVYQAAYNAGRELATTGAMRDETLAAVSKELMPLRQFTEGANAYFGQMIEKSRRKAETPSA
jgi:multimeric flavodoxin WrbA